MIPQVNLTKTLNIINKLKKIKIVCTGWTTINNKCYLLVNLPRNYLQAEQFCESLNMKSHLPIFKTTIDLDLKLIYNYSNDIWVRKLK